MSDAVVGMASGVVLVNGLRGPDTRTLAVRVGGPLGTPSSFVSGRASSYCLTIAGERQRLSAYMTTSRSLMGARRASYNQWSHPIAGV
jgi:hypothetical protein